MGDKYDDADWFRSSRWSSAIAEDFEARLGRARPGNRQQYIRVQGTHLVAQDDPALREIGRALFRRAAYESGQFDFEALMALEQLGDSLVADGHLDEAEPILREVLVLVAAAPTGRSGTSHVTGLALAELLQARGGADALTEADDLLDAAEPQVRQLTMFRNLALRFLVCRARVAAARGLAQARDYARQALEVAAETEPSLPRQTNVGRPAASPKLRRELSAIERRFR